MLKFCSEQWHCSSSDIDGHSCFVRFENPIHCSFMSLFMNDHSQTMNDSPFIFIHSENVAKKLGIDEVIAEVLPHQKAEKIRQLKSDGYIVAMAGDGINDAPALVESDLGIAIGAGTDVAIESADIVLVRSNPKDVVNLLKLSKATSDKMIQNLIWATGYNIIALPLAAGVLYQATSFLLPPAIGAILMSLSSIIVAINAKTLKIKQVS